MSERGVVIYNKFIEACGGIYFCEVEEVQYILAKLKSQFSDDPDGQAARKIYEAVEILFEDAP